MKATRPGQLRWLHSHRTEATAWEAYESLDGQPFLFLSRGQSWRSVSIWLSDLARELASRDEADATEALSLERIWVTADGRGKLLHFRAPGLSPDRSPRTNSLRAKLSSSSTTPRAARSMHPCRHCPSRCPAFCAPWSAADSAAYRRS